MNPSLTVVLPLHNVESSLPTLLTELLEILPELTPRFDVVMVDDGSTDGTIDTAHELSLQFPQVQLLVHPTKLGAQEALRSALRYSQGETLLVCRDPAEFDPHELAKVWGSLTSAVAVAGMYETSGGVGTIPRLPAKSSATKPGAKAAESPLPDLLLVPRRLLLGWQQSGDRQGLLTHLRTSGFAMPMVAIRSRRSRAPSLATLAAGIRRGLQARPSGATARRAENAGRRTPASGGEHTKIDSPTGAQVRGPSYLMSRLRAFTWGE
ncbi:MAG: glycosyltransferase family 2 protein [Planctomycetia bacterium]|nr:glycosyltransferase family 2 protein [Planctomycetia bacterium]